MKFTDTQLKQIISEAITKVLSEGDLSQNMSNYRKSISAWNMIYDSLDNIKRAMDATAQNKGGIRNIGASDVEMILEYIDMTIDNCLSSTLPNLRK